MRFLFVIFFYFSTLFMSGCWWEEEDKRESLSGGLTPKELFLQAKDLSEGGNLEESIKLYEKLSAAYPSSRYSHQAKLEIPYMLFKREKFDEAIDELNNYIKIYPNHSSTPYAYYMRGLISQSKTQSILDELNITDNAERDTSSVIESFNYYLDLIRKFPNSEYSNFAEDQLIVLRNTIARHELLIAIFYTKTDAHIAAVNRSKYIIEKFPNTPSVPAALHLLAYNYDKINANDLAEDTRRVLKDSFPKYIPHYSLED